MWCIVRRLHLMICNVLCAWAKTLMGVGATSINGVPIVSTHGPSNEVRRSETGAGASIEQRVYLITACCGKIEIIALTEMNDEKSDLIVSSICMHKNKRRKKALDMRFVRRLTEEKPTVHSINKRDSEKGHASINLRTALMFVALVSRSAHQNVCRYSS